MLRYIFCFRFGLIRVRGLESVVRSSRTHDARPRTHDARPMTHDARPMTHDARPMTHDARPMTHDARRTTPDSRPQTQMYRLSILLCFFCLPVAVNAQPVVLTNVPSGAEAVPGFGEPYLKYRPGLSVNGFDCEVGGRTCDHGLGLKQILEKVYGEGGESEHGRLFDALVDLASKTPVTPADRGDVKKNALIAEAQGLLALATLLLEEHGVANLGLPAHVDIYAAFKSTLLTPALLQFVEDFSDDAVKWTGPLGSVARAMDFYFALEKAYIHYGRTDASFFSCEVKGSLLARFDAQMQIVTDLGNKSAMELKFIKILGFDIADILNDISYDEIQAGNWPLKVHASVGYAALAQQQSVSGACGSLLEDNDYDHWIQRAFRSAAGPSTKNRSHHWRFQTQDGGRFWAEGPFYFNYALATTLPLWHTVRSQNLLDLHDDFEVIDPFHAGWFIEPLHGLVDLVTPEGGVPPLEDGNKIPLETAFLMRWDRSYGNTVIGEKAAWIAAAQGKLPSEDLWVHALALPLAQQLTPPTATVLHVESPVILRRDGGSGACDDLPEDRVAPCHYMLLNGETERSIGPGEGHEQSDQLQLLYYIDDTSYLIDGGYDSAPGIQNSSWSDYRYHNIMRADRRGHEGGHGGMPGAIPGLLCERRTSTPVGDLIIPFPCMFADHRPVESRTHERHERVDLVEASISIFPDSPRSGDEVAYRRSLFFVDDPAGPYIVDINAAEAKDPQLAPEIQLTMQYLGNAAVSDVGSSSVVWRALWEAPDSSGAQPVQGDEQLSIQGFAVESDATLLVSTEAVREPFIAGLMAGEGLEVDRLTLSNLSGDTIVTPSHTTVAFISPDLTPDEHEIRPLVSISDDVHREAQFFVVDRNPFTRDIIAVRAASATATGALTQSLGDDESASWAIDSGYATPGINYDESTGIVRLDPNTRVAFLRLVKPTADSNENDTVLAKRQFSIRPNPVQSTATIRFSLSQAMPIRLAIYDTIGRRVDVIADEVWSAGTHEFVWNANQLPAGVYFCRLIAGGESLVQQVILVD